jgi:hypothetical protein
LRLPTSCCLGSLREEGLPRPEDSLALAIRDRDTENRKKDEKGKLIREFLRKGWLGD